MLVADAYEGARIPCAKYLNRFGFGVIEAGDTSQVLSYLDAGSAHVVLVDDDLLPAELRKGSNRLGATVPLIVMTAALETSQDDLAELPLVSVLKKPFSLTTMLEEVRRLLRSQPAAAG